MNLHRSKFGVKNGSGVHTAPSPSTPTSTPAAQDNATVALDAVTKAAGDAVREQLKSLPDAVKSAVGGADITKVVQDAVAAAFKATQPAPAAPAQAQPQQASATVDLTKVMQDAVKGALDEIRTKTPNLLEQPGRNQIEIPMGHSKGNLPVHMKQLLNIAMRRDVNHGLSEKDVEDATRLGDETLWKAKVVGAKAITTSGTGTGLEWQPRDLSAELQRRLYLESDVARAFMDTEVNMPTDPFDYPLVKDDGEFQSSIPETAEVEPSDPTTGKLTLTTASFMGLRQISTQATEDSVVAILPEIEAGLARAGARAIEQALINGDTTATHQDSDVTNARDVRKSWKGWRKLSLAVSALKVDISSGGISRANLTALLKLLGKWGSPRTNDLLWIFGPKAHATMMGLDEFALAYARGAASSFAEGNLPKAPWGGSYAVSEAMRENLNASGVYDGATTTKGAIIVLNKTQFRMGYRRMWMIETEKRARSQMFDIVASFRRAFSPLETPAATTAQTCAIAYNYTA